jgi:PAS domain S-box-containing protein
LQARIALTVIVVTLAVGLFAGIAAVTTTGRTLEQEQARNAGYLARLIAESKLPEVIAGDADGVRDLLVRLVRDDPAIEYALVYGFDGDLFAHSFEGPVPDALRARAATAASVPIAATEQYRAGELMIVQAVRPLVPGELGRVHVGVSDRAYRSLLSTLTLEVGLAVALVAVVALVLSRLLARRLLRAYDELGRLLEDYGRGQNLDPRRLEAARVPPELRPLVASMSTMAAERHGLEQALREAKGLLERVLDTIPVRVFWKDRDGRYLGCNRAFAQDAGHVDPAGLVGKTDLDMPWGGQADAYRADDALVIARGHPKLNYIEPQSTSRRPGRTLRTSKVPLRDAQGRTFGVLGTYEDITEERRQAEDLAQSERHLRLAQTAARIGSWEWDITNNAVHWSEGVGRLFGLPEGRFPGTYEAYLELVHPEDLKSVVAVIEEALHSSTEFFVEHRVIWPDGSLHHLQARGEVTRGPLGEPLRLVGVVMDVTEASEAAAALRESEARLNEAQALAGLGSWTLELGTGSAQWSDQTFRLLGFEPGEVEAHFDTFMRLVHPEDREAIQATIERAVAEPQCEHTLEHRVLLADGRECVLLERTRAVLDAEGGAGRLVGTMLDVTTLRQTELALARSETHLRQVITSAPIIVWATDREGRITLSEGAGLAALQLRPGQVVGQSVYELYADIPEVVDMFDHALAGETLSAQPEVAGRMFVTHCAPLRLADGTVSGVIGVSLDETERQLAERELAAYRERLEELVAERTHALQALNEELQAFSYSVSHDLRAPLRAIDGFSQALLEDHAPSLSPEAVGYLDRVRAAAQRMGRLIDHLLTLSRVARIDLQTEAVDMVALVDEVLSELRAGDRARAVAVEVAALPPVLGDRNLIRVVLANLLGNSWKFTARRDEASIRVGFGRPEAPEAFFVEDNGVGFDMKYADKLFDPFQRLHKTLDFPGSGIGLATVRRIVQRHGGRVWARAELDVGACVYFELPLAEARDQRVGRGRVAEGG